MRVIPGARIITLRIGVIDVEARSFERRAAVGAIVSLRTIGSPGSSGEAVKTIRWRLGVARSGKVILPFS
jgi:hypothetical protein